jgi:hypothetical protein
MGTLMNDTYITREDSNGNVVSLLRVPVTYAPKDKMLARVMQNPALDNQTATSIPLPCISFEMGPYYYDQSRKLPTINKVVVRDNDDTSKFRYQYNYVPYNFTFKVHVYCKNAEDGSKIIEQILPYFTPDWTTTVRLISDMEETKDIPVVLEKVTPTDHYDGKFTDRRVLIHTLDMTMKGYLWGPIKRSAIIKFVKVNMRITDVPDGDIRTHAVGNTAISERYTVQPGLTANGEPTTNINNTISYLDIDIDDDFGYISQVISGADIDEENE